MRVQRDIAVLVGDHGGGNHHHGAGPDGPGHLGQSFLPDVDVDQALGIQGEGVLQALVGTLAGQGVDHQTDQQTEQAGHQNGGHLFQRLLLGDAEVDQDQCHHPNADGGRIGRCDRGEQGFLIHAEVAARQGHTGIAEAPGQDHQIVRQHQQIGQRGEHAQAGIFLAADVVERAGCGVTGRAAHEVFYIQKGKCRQEHADRHNDDEGRAAGVGHQTREAPQVAGAHAAADQHADQREAG